MNSFLKRLRITGFSKVGWQSRRQGFTLAEVLITLGIIGVVSAMTIPQLINNSQKVETVAKLKKTYSIIYQAIKQSEIDNGNNQYWDWGTYGNAVSIIQTFNTYWAPYIRIAKICSSYSDCNYNSLEPWLTTNNATYQVYVADVNSRTSFILSDGSFIIVKNYETTGTLTKTIFVDINASKSPNKLGRDVFMLTIDSDRGIIPYGDDLSDSDVSDNCKDSGEYCATKIIRDGWQIKDDYPW